MKDNCLENSCLLKDLPQSCEGKWVPPILREFVRFPSAWLESLNSRDITVAYSWDESTLSCPPSTLNATILCPLPSRMYEKPSLIFLTSSFPLAASSHVDFPKEPRTPDNGLANPGKVRRASPSRLLIFHHAILTSIHPMKIQTTLNLNLRGYAPGPVIPAEAALLFIPAKTN